MGRRPVLAACVIGAAMVSYARADEAFVGRWAMSPEVCAAHGGDTAATSALVATDTSLWWFDGYCRIGKMYKTKAIYVQAHCAKGDVSVTLDAAGDRLRVTWDRGKAWELRRCPQEIKRPGAVVTGGLGTILVTAIWMFLFPELRRIRSLDGATEAQAAKVAGTEPL